VNFGFHGKEDNANSIQLKDLNIVLHIVAIYKIKYNAHIKKVCLLINLNSKNICLTALKSEIKLNKNKVFGIISPSTKLTNRLNNNHNSNLSNQNNLNNKYF